jgi:hypothetical protein
MIERFFPILKLGLAFDQYEALPRNPAYIYEYAEGSAWLWPRPNLYRAFLRLPLETAVTEIDAKGPVRLRPLHKADWAQLPSLFAEAFENVLPFSSLDDQHRIEASRACLGQTRQGHDGPLIDEACFVAVSQADGEICGSILITLLADPKPNGAGGRRWKGPPPVDWRARKVGRPHLTWVFVHPWEARFGVGSALLALVAAPLRALGHEELDSTFLLGNESSTLWHWRNGFVLRPYVGPA